MGELRKDRRRYLTQDELTRLITAAKQGRYGQRDANLANGAAWIAVSEAIDLEWDQIDFTRAHLHVRRLKGGIASVHPLQGDEHRALRELRRATEGAFVFASERGGPMTRSNVAKMIAAAGKRASLPYPTRIALGILAAISWPTLGTTPDAFSSGLVTLTSSTQRTTASFQQNHSRSSGNEAPAIAPGKNAATSPCCDGAGETKR